MTLKAEKYDEYWSRGWTVVEGVFAADQANAVGELAMSLCRQELNQGDESHYVVDRSEQGELAPRKLDDPFLRHPALRAFALNLRLRALIEQFIGKPPLLLTDQIFMKPPRFGSAKPYHQDNAYFLCHPADEVITAWIAFDDVDQSNGCLRYIEGSHRGPILEHVTDPDQPHNKEPASDQIDLKREAPACVKQGGVVFHHSKALHTSHCNESESWRRGYATHWASADVTSEIDTIDNAYYNRCPQLYAEALKSHDL